MKGKVVAYCNVLSWHLFGETEKSCRIPHTRYLFSDQYSTRVSHKCKSEALPLCHLAHWILDGMVPNLSTLVMITSEIAPSSIF
jgi:hypothetical protein